MPAPGSAPANDRVKLGASVAINNAVLNLRAFIRELAREGNLAGVVFKLLMDGFGGDSVCKDVSDDCECVPDPPPQVLTSPWIPFEAELTDATGAVTYTVKYELQFELDILRAHCAEGPF